MLERICQQIDINRQEKDRLEDAVKNWYKGYLIYKTTIYNPYSIMNFIRVYIQALDLEKSLKCYWPNNREIKYIKQCYKRLRNTGQASLGKLFAHQAVEQWNLERFNTLKVNQDSLLNVLFYGGYLTVSTTGGEYHNAIVICKIPNKEVSLFLYKSVFPRWS